MSRINWEPTDTTGVWIGEAAEPGPTVGIIGGVHGDETAGPIVVDAARANISLDCGTLVLMHGNLPAIHDKKRYIEVNLNRCFRDLTDEEQEVDPEELPAEVRRAQALLPYLDECSALLDLHEHQYKGDIPFIICEPNAFETAKRIGAPVISYGWSATEPGGTDGYMYERGKEGLCYELGSKYEPKTSVQRGQEVVKRFLGAQGLNELETAPLFGNPSFVAVHQTFTRTSDTYSLARDFHCFEPLAEGELVATDGRKSIYGVSGEVIIFPDRNPEIGAEAFTIGRITTPS